jgi:hypothetical protein
MKLHAWTDFHSFLAVAHAESVARARELLMVEMGESGDGSCPERDKARQIVLTTMPEMWQGPSAHFALSDSAELREQEALTARLEVANARLRKVLWQSGRLRPRPAPHSRSSLDE